MDRSLLWILATAYGVMWVGPYNAISYGEQTMKAFNEVPAEIHGREALLAPVFSSLALLVLFYFAGFSTVLILLCAFSSVYSIGFCIYPFCRKALGTFGANSAQVPYFGLMTFCDIATLALGILPVLSWIMTGHWMLNNLIGVAFCVSSMTVIRIPNAKTAALLLTALFFYDIFWVFYSEYIFNKNVMVEVASTHSDNPVVVIAQQVNITLPIAQQLDLPVKLMFPRETGSFAMLGLGDMVLPGLFLSYVLRFDQHKGLSLRSGYFVLSYIGYVVGLLCAFVAVVSFHIAQPALLYLVPCSVIPVFFAAHRRGDLGEVWAGPKRKRDDPDDANDDHHALLP